MKILFFTDSHLKGVNPISRKGSFFDDAVLKFREIGDMVVEHKVNKVLFGGDIFDKPIVALNMVDTIVDIMEGWGVEVWVVRGNHDEIGHNPNASGESVLDHIFRRSDIIKHLGGQSFEDVYIEGFDFYHNIEQDIKEHGLNSAMPQLECPQIAVVHAFIVDKPFLPTVPHVAVKDIKSDFDLILVGHTHPPFGVIKRKETTFVGVGAVSRLSITDMDMKPSVVLIDTAKPSLKIVPLKSAKESKEVFDISKVEGMKLLQCRLDDFIASIDSAKFQGLNITNIVERLAQENNIDKEVVAIILERIARYDTA